MTADIEKVIKAVEEAFDLVHSDFIGTDDFNEKEWEQNKADALVLLKSQPQIVRCKDCKFWYKDECSHLCAITGDLRPKDWFCADGEHK